MVKSRYLGSGLVFCLLRRVGEQAATGSALVTYGYTGRAPDQSGLTYYRARYDDPSVTFRHIGASAFTA